MLMSAMAYILGIDLGTTAVKVSVIDLKTHKVVDLQSEDTHAYVTSETSPLGNEQDHSQIFQACESCIIRLQDDHRKNIIRIGVSGQMHGLILWNSKMVKNLLGKFQDHFRLSNINSDCTSHLFTWQDARCSSDFLDTLPRPDSHLNLATGHGCATLFWLKRNCSNYFEKTASGSEPERRFDSAGTIMDLLTVSLCGLTRAVMSVQNAASWGYYNTETNSWNTIILEKEDFPVYLLPGVKQAPTKLGTLHSSWLDIPEGTDVGVAMGDLQCSVLPHLNSNATAVVNIGTSAQVVVVCPKGFAPAQSNSSSTVTHFPFFQGLYLSVAASLNGGNVLSATVKMLQRMMRMMSIPEQYIHKEIIFNMLIETGRDIDTDLKIKPTLYGERHAPSEKGSIMNITPSNLDIGHISRAVCCGLIGNLVDMLPREDLIAAGVDRIVGCGYALIKNEVLQEELRLAYELPVKFSSDSNAAVGGAVALARFWEH